ncbi:MAG TPA: hypothetical protein VGH92_07145 [Gaiellaceae bacterium]
MAPARSLHLRRRFAVLAIAAAVAGPVTAQPAAAAPSLAACTSSYVAASLPWGHKCLRAGEFCKVGNVAYRRYGFVCPSTGHLQRR